MQPERANWIRKRTVQALVLAGVVAISLGSVSFWKHFSYDARPLNRVWCQVVLAGGNFRFIVAIAPAADTYVSAPDAPPGDWLSGDTPVFSSSASSSPERLVTEDDVSASLDYAKLFWERHLLVTRPWSWRIYDRAARDQTHISLRELRVDLSGFILGIAFVCGALLLGPCRHMILHAPGVLREIRHPTGGSFSGPWPRAPRRVVIGLLGTIAIAAAMLTISPIDSPVAWTMKLERDVRASVSAGRLVLSWDNAISNTVSKSRFGFLGFELQTVTSPRFNVGSTINRPKDWWLTMSAAAIAKTLGPVTTTRTTTMKLSLFYPLVLCAAYPLFALFRGPVRRFRRRLHGCCIRCGYNLTGNMSGVCSECGESIEQDALPDE